MVQQQGGDNGFFALAQLVLIHSFAWSILAQMLPWLSTAPLATPVMPPCIATARYLRGLMRQVGKRASPLLSMPSEGNGFPNTVFGHHFLDFPDDEIDQRTFKQPEHFADGGDDDVFDLRARQHQLQRVGEIFQKRWWRSHRCLSTDALARAVYRADWCSPPPTCLQNTERGNRVLQYVGQHNGNTFVARRLEDVCRWEAKSVASLLVSA